MLSRRPEVKTETLLEAVRRHERALAEDPSAVLKADHRAATTRVAGGDGLPALCVKEFRRPGPGQRVEDWLRGSPARRAWLGAQACSVHGVRIPPALGAVEAGERSFLVSELVTGAVSFDDFVSEHGRPVGEAAQRRWLAFVDAAGDFVRHLHAQPLVHRDLASKNLLVREHAGAFELFLIDLNDIRLGQRPSLRLRERNLGQLAQLKVYPAREDLCRFLRRCASDAPELLRPEVTARIEAMGRARHQRWWAHSGAQWIAERRRLGKPVPQLGPEP